MTGVSSSKKIPDFEAIVPRVIPAPLRWRLVHLAQHIWVARMTRAHPIVSLHGVRIPVSRALSDNIRAALFGGYYESAEVRTIESKLDPEDIVMEVGAGLGFVSSLCAMKIGADRVFAYEANPGMEKAIRAVYSLNNVAPTLLMCLVGAEDSEQDFFLGQDFWASSTKADQLRGVVATKLPCISFNKEIRRLDPTFLIMDIEGGEYDIFQSIDFCNLRKIAIELHTDVLGQSKIDLIKTKMALAGFKICEELSNHIPGVKEVLFLQRDAAPLL